MERYVAFLRGINLGKRRPPMSHLKELFEKLGFGDVETFIASGNVIFSSKVTETSALEAKIAKHLETSLGYGVDTFIRTMDEVAAVGKAKIFPEEGKDGVAVYVAFLQQKLPADIAKKLGAVRTANDEVRVAGREFYWMCHGIPSNESKVWTLPEVKAMKLPSSTMRNITSIRKLHAKHHGRVLGWHRPPACHFSVPPEIVKQRESACRSHAPCRNPAGRPRRAGGLCHQAFQITPRQYSPSSSAPRSPS